MSEWLAGVVQAHLCLLEGVVYDDGEERGCGMIYC